MLYQWPLSPAARGGTRPVADSQVRAANVYFLPGSSCSTFAVTGNGKWRDDGAPLYVVRADGVIGQIEADPVNTIIYMQSQRWLDRQG